MGEYLRETLRKRGEQAGPPGRLARAGVSGLVVVLLLLGLALLVVALVRLSPLAIAGALVVIGSGCLWWWSNRVSEPAAGTRSRYGEMAEARLAFASLTGLLVGLCGWAIAMVKGW